MLPRTELPMAVIDIEQDDSEDNTTELSPVTATTLDDSTSSGASSATGTTSQVIERRKTRKSWRQATQGNLDSKMIAEDERNRYSLAFKEATTEIQREREDAAGSGITKKRKKKSDDIVIAEVNRKHGLLPCKNGGTKLLARSTVLKAIARGDAGERDETQQNLPNIATVLY